MNGISQHENGTGQHEQAGRRGRPHTPKRWYSVSEAARMLGMARMTLYRAIQDGEFPAVKIRGRYVIPAKALDALEEAALDSQSLVIAGDVSPSGEFA